MPQGSLLKSLTLGGRSWSNQGAILREFDSLIDLAIDLPAGKTGDLTTRTDDETGSITMDSASHGITTGAIVDIYWTGGVRYGVTVGTVSGTTVPIGADDSGSGDVLPSQATELVVTEQVTFQCPVDGDAVEIFGAILQCASDANAVGHLQLQDTGDAEIAEFDLVEVSNATGLANCYDITGGDTNPLTGNPITQGLASNGSSTAAAKLYLTFGINLTE